MYCLAVHVSRPTLLVPVVSPEPDLYPMSDMHLDGLSGFDIVLSGYWEIPEQQPPQSARDAHQTEADAVLYETAAQFSRVGARTEIRLAFGPAGAAEQAHHNRMIAETGADGVLLADHLESLHNLVVPLRDVRHQDQIIDLVSAFDADSLFVLELYHVAASEEAVESATEMLREIEQTLLARGFSEADLELKVEVADDAKAAIAANARDHHLVVMGETEKPEAADRLFGPVCTYIAEESGTPIIVVQE